MVQGNATFLHFPKETASQPNQNTKIKLVFGRSLVHEMYSLQTLHAEFSWERDNPDRQLSRL